MMYFNSRSFAFLLLFFLHTCNVNAEYLKVDHVADGAARFNAVAAGGKFYLLKESSKFGLYEVRNKRLNRLAGVCCFPAENTHAQFVSSTGRNEIFTLENVTGKPLKLRLWSLLGKHLAGLDLQNVSKNALFTVSQDERALYVYDGGEITLINLQNMRIVKKIALNITDNIVSLKGSSDSRYLAVATEKNTVNIYDVSTEKMVTSIAVEEINNVRSLLFYGGDQEKLILTFNDGAIVQYSIHDAGNKAVFSGNRNTGQLKNMFMDEEGGYLYGVTRDSVSVYSLEDFSRKHFLHVRDMIKDIDKNNSRHIWFNASQYDEGSKALFLLDNTNSISKVSLQSKGVSSLILRMAENESREIPR